MRALAGDEGKEDWLETAQAEFEKLANLVEQTLITPTDKLMELMYQSVQIRDSRHNLELGMSVWRLSWITFIFLPLTFLVGFFDIDPSRKDRIKWYVITMVPVTAIVVTLWFSFKYSSAAPASEIPHAAVSTSTSSILCPTPIRNYGRVPDRVRTSSRKVSPAG